MSSSYEMANYDFDNQLFECCILTITILLDQYKDNTINITEFKNNTTNKINYILNNFGILKDSTKKRSIENLINECIKINNTF